MKFELHHYHHRDAELMGRIDAVQHALLGLVNVLNGQQGSLMAIETAVERLQREAKETKVSADAAVAGIADLKVQLKAQADQITTLTSQLRGNIGDADALNAVADQLDKVQSSISDALNPPAVVDPAAAGEPAATPTTAPSGAASSGGTPTP